MGGCVCGRPKQPPALCRITVIPKEKTLAVDDTVVVFARMPSGKSSSQPPPLSQPTILVELVHIKQSLPRYNDRLHSPRVQPTEEQYPLPLASIRQSGHTSTLVVPHAPSERSSKRSSRSASSKISSLFPSIEELLHPMTTTTSTTSTTTTTTTTPARADTYLAIRSSRATHPPSHRAHVHAHINGGGGGEGGDDAAKLRLSLPSPPRSPVVYVSPKSIMTMKSIW